MKDNTYRTREVAKMAGVHRDTLLRWLREGRVPEPARDRNNWRAFTLREAEAITQYAEGKSDNFASELLESQVTYHLNHPYFDGVTRLSKLSWDFIDVNTSYLTHTIHPYPCKFIPQIPNTLIQELSSVGETVFDPFCGSGTTLVEALRLGRHAVGIDANPLACLISRAKTTRISDTEVTVLQTLAEEIQNLGERASVGVLPLFPDLPVLPTTAVRPRFKGVDEWFDPHVVDELAFVKEKCLALDSANARQLALAAFSSIIVNVSRQDSDTRYVRRDKNIKRGDTLQQFSRALNRTIQRAVEFTEEVDSQLSVQVHEVNVLAGPDIDLVDLVVCSPPYPNAFSYHLYHRTRMLWLDMDQPRFKREEIGSHRKYSRKGPNAATVETFRRELHTILTWLTCRLRPNRHACFVIGDSTLKGETIENDKLLIEVAESTGFQVEANIKRRLQDSRKSFNPTIGKIKQEHIVVLRNRGGEQ